jgi:RHS repeat-associated protein
MDRKIVLLFVAVMLAVPFGHSQSDPAAGIQLFSTNNFGIDLASSNVSLQFPARSKVGKLPFSSTFVGNSHAYFAIGTNWGVNNTFGIYISPLVTVEGAVSGSCGTHDRILTGISIIDGTGAQHSVPNATVILCPGYNSGTWYTSDGSGYTFVVSNGAFTVYDRNGVANPISPPITGHDASFKATDPDGASVYFVTSTSEWMDSLGVAALTAIGNCSGSGSFGYSYLDGNGNTSNYCLIPATTNYNILTNFQCSTIAEYTGFFGPVLTLLMPDGSHYGFSYETTPGKSGYYTKRIAGIALPTGGSISYSYSDSAGHNGMNCTSGVVPKITVTVNDNNGNPNQQWTYVNNNNNAPSSCAPGAGPCNYTVVTTDPALNQTVYNFAGEFQTMVDSYQGGCPTTIVGCTGGGTKLREVTTCYNGHLSGGLSGCQTLSTVPIPAFTQTDVYTWVGMTRQALTETIYDCKTVNPCFGTVTEVKKYDYGASIPPTQTPLSDTVTVYNTGNTCGTINQFIRNRPCSITVSGSSGQVSQTKYTYNAAGHPTQTQQWVAGSNFLTSSSAYGTNGAAAGVLSSSTDVNGAITSYENFICNLMLPTTISYPLSLTSSQSWDSGCNGGVQESTTDVNQNPTTYAHGDPLWRMTAATDQNYPSTNLQYPDATHAESFMNFNGSVSTVDTTTTTDGLGRPILVQKKQGQGSSNFDSVQSQYAWTTTGSVTGALAKQSQPYSGSPTAWTKTQYDALGRVYTVTDAGGNVVTTYTYSGNDVLIDVTAPPGENHKKRQLEYDGLGRLISVCEISAGSSTGCTQSNTIAAGYWTQYAYGTNTLTVTQNSLGSTSQTRNYYYDGLGRLTKEINPENGTTQYFWDAAPAACLAPGGYATPGDLGAKLDNANVYTCYGYDGLHRLLGFDHPNNTNCTGFAYDSATPPTGVTVSNTAGRLIEAYTNSACDGHGSIVTDTWFGYSPRGEITEIYSSTPNSNGFYHISKTYWENGAVKTLSGIPGVPTITYGADGEGRTSTVSASTGQNPVTATVYNPASQVTSLTFGSTDSDNYTYDPNTGRMTQYKFTVNGQSMISTPGWNTNGTLHTLNITDPFNSANQQNCSYGYDDLGRVGSANCGSVWAQTFSYDAFGNITKTGSISWACATCYDQTKNRYNSTLSSLITYDAVGNLTYDTFHPRTWDANGHVVLVDGTWAQTYDGQGHMVEVNQLPTSFASSVTQYLYDPDGSLLGSSKAQTAATVNIPLPGGAQAGYTGGALAHYRHVDWLGTVRLDSSPSRTVLADLARAPFGEPYAVSGTSLESFAGMTQTFQTDFFDTPNRSYHPTQGRWLRPDPSGFQAADMTNPQSWNRYAYVLNGPLSYTDPTGLDCVYDNGDGTTFTKTGDCYSSTDNGFYFDGNVDQSSINIDQNGDVLARVDGGDVQCSGDCPGDSVTVNSVLPSDIATISAYHGSVGQCLGQAAIDAGLDLTSLSLLPGADQDNWQWSSDKFGFVYTGAAADESLSSASKGVDVLEKTAGFVESSGAAQRDIRKLLKSEGVKVSLKHVSKDAAFVGKWAGRAGMALAAKSAYNRYQKCRGY